MMRLAVVTTHPIQYNAPLFQLLSERNKVQLKVFYTWGKAAMQEKFDQGFGRSIAWDVPLLDGYDYQFLENIASDPGSHHFNGIDNPDIIKQIIEWEAEAVLVYGWSFKSHLKVMRYFKGKIPVLFRGDSTLLKGGPFIRRFLRRTILIWIYKRVDLALYVGENNRQYYLKHGLREKQLIHAPHAVDNHRFSKNHESVLKSSLIWREKIGILPSDFVVLFCGKIEANKNPFFLVNLSKEIMKKNIKFLIVGSGPLEKDIKASVANDERFVFLDFQNQSKMPEVYRMGDVFILPSQSETWGLALNEAMACRLPIVASEKVGGAIDLIEMGKNGICFKNGDVKKVGDYIVHLSEEKEQCLEAGEYSLKHITKFSFEAIAGAIENAIAYFKYCMYPKSVPKHS